MKIFLYIATAIILFLAILFSLPQDDAEISSFAGSARNVNGKNLVSSNILSDPSVLASADVAETLNCEFPSNWQYTDDLKEFGHQLTMWFTSLADGRPSISAAESKNGIIWENVKETVLKSGPDWDKIGVETASVIKDPQGKYRMYYSSSLKDSDDFAIGLALSDDGKSWRKNDKPVFEPENDWEKGDPNGVLEPSVIYDSAEKKYKMWYNALGIKDDELAFRIGYATSADGMSWQRLKQPVLEPGAEGAWDDVLVSHANVVKSRNGYHMFYFGVSDWSDGAAFQRGAIGQAYSPDGINWQKDPKNPIIKPRAGQWDMWTIGGPSALAVNNEIWLWYFGNSKKDSYAGRIGLVKGSCF